MIHGRVIIMSLIVSVLLLITVNAGSTTSSNNLYYPIEVIFDPNSYLDSSEVVSLYGDASTYDDVYEVEDDIINYGINRLTNPNLISYYDHKYPYQLSIINPSSLNTLSDVANVIKTSKIAVIATAKSFYSILYDPSTETLTVSSLISINDNLDIDRNLGYYNYVNNVPPDNTSTRFVILATHASTLYYRDFWKNYSNAAFGATVYVEDNTVSEGLYSIDVVVAIDSYPMILYANGQQFIFNPLTTPYPLYWPYYTATLYAGNIGSYIGKFINYFSIHLEQQEPIKEAYYNAINDLSYNTYDQLQYCYIKAYWSGTSKSIPPYSGNPRIVVIFNSNNGNTPVVQDPSSPVPCPPNSPYCNIPLLNPYNDLRR